jgi:hypothetical protein
MPIGFQAFIGNRRALTDNRSFSVKVGVFATCRAVEQQMIVVFWLEHRSPEGQPHAKIFGANELTQALRFADELRKRRAGGESISHVAIQSELAGNVGRAGVADPQPGYAHDKRRIDPATPLGRPSGCAPQAPGEYVIGWKLDREQRGHLLSRLAPRYPLVVADHVTLRPGVSRDAVLPPRVDAMIVGRSDDDLGVEALIVEVDGTTDRPDGSTYHITWSLAEGREAIESNSVIARLGWQRVEPAIRVELHPQRFP